MVCKLIDQKTNNCICFNVRTISLTWTMFWGPTSPCGDQALVLTRKKAVLVSEVRFRSKMWMEFKWGLRWRSGLGHRNEWKMNASQWKIPVKIERHAVCGVCVCVGVMVYVCVVRTWCLQEPTWQNTLFQVIKTMTKEQFEVRLQNDLIHWVISSEQSAAFQRSWL